MAKPRLYREANNLISGMVKPSSDFGVYVHWPFCLAKCPYCDFNSHVRETIDQADWRDGLVREIRHIAALTPGRTVTSIFFGGGTPSLIPPETVKAVIDTIEDAWGLSESIEITLEANPTSTEASKFAAFSDAGVNRISIGVQALDNESLSFLGREHDVAEALEAIATARDTVSRYSFDLIYARPGQTVPAWEDELGRALELTGDHLSVYQLTIEEGTAFHAAWRSGRLVLPDEDTQAALYETTHDIMGTAGLPAYEISNHARPGFESRHNLTYWRYGEYAGIGPGAHGRLHLDEGVTATANRRKPESWLGLVNVQGHGLESSDPAPPVLAAEEMLMMGLRTKEGINLARFQRLTGAPLEAHVNTDALHTLADDGLIARTPTHLHATAKGWPILNAVTGALLS